MFHNVTAKKNWLQGLALFLGALLKWNSRQKAAEALFVIEYESNLHVNAYTNNVLNARAHV